jgi:regulator of ribonuclease activity A
MEAEPIKTCDLYDKVGDEARVIGSELINYGGKDSFAGTAVTIKCFEDNSILRSVVQSAGAGRVLAIDGGGSCRCALLGDMLAKAALKNGWVGLIIDGCVRDSAELAKLDIGIMARGTTPRKSNRLGEGQSDLEIHVAGILIRPGDTIVADADGIIVIDAQVRIKMTQEASF